MNYRIGICDDSVTDQKYITELVQRWAERMQYKVCIDTFLSAESFLFHYAEHKDYDILLLDIEMGAMDGVELAKKLREENSDVQIVFITGFPDFMAEGYEVSALHYLIKPANITTLTKVLDKAVGNLKKVERSVVFQVDGETTRIPVSQIIYIESFAHSCKVETATGHFEVRMGISAIEKMLGEGFVRTHRSYLVGVRFIKSILKSDVVLDNGERILLSRNNYQMVNQEFIKYFRGEAQ